MDDEVEDILEFAKLREEYRYSTASVKTVNSKMQLIEESHKAIMEILLVASEAAARFFYEKSIQSSLRF